MEPVQKDQGTLEQRYFDLKVENDQSKENTNSCKSELQNLKEQFNALKNRFNQVQDALEKANDGISRLVARNNELCKELKEAGGNDEKCS